MSDASRDLSRAAAPSPVGLVAPPADVVAGSSVAVRGEAPPRDDAGLREELAKWRDRVPKLALALRQRTEEVRALREALDRTQEQSPAGQPPAAGIRARDELIAELEGKLAALAQRHNEAQGELHRRQLALDEVRSDAVAWKDKWQALTRTLDDQAAAAERQAADRDTLQKAIAERDAARERNAQLEESVLLAGRQVAALTSDVTGLRAALSEQRAESAREREEAERQHAAAVEAAQVSARAAAEDANAGIRAAAQEAAARAAEQVRVLDARVRHLTTQLEERSRLVVSLEADLAKHAEQRRQQESEHDDLQEALRRAERNVRENAEHVTQLDDKLERQKQLMTELEAELAEAHRVAQSRRTEEIQQQDTLRSQVRKLETLLGDRTEAFNRLQRQVDMAAQPAGGTSRAPDPGPAADPKVLMVLNQQLEAARRENAALLARVRELEPQAGLAAEAPVVDDLTRIRGIGSKLAHQLNALGVRHFRQIAEVQPGDLENPQHQLYPYRSRIGRDQWIEQAARLAAG